jgi:hypothetical protein
MCDYWQMFINCQQMPASVMNAGELINLPLLKTTFSTWATPVKGTE